jgi:hypothetical protein
VKLIVWMDAWQLQCCGAEFDVGTRVSWTLTGMDQHWAELLGLPVDAAEEHHGGVPDDAPATSGTVTGIRAEHFRYAPANEADQRTLSPVAGSAVFTWVSHAGSWGADPGDLEFAGYLAELRT